MIQKKLNENLKEYWKQIVNMEQLTMNSYDKTLTALSSGAIGISFLYYKELFDRNIVRNWLIITSWISWTLSLAILLIAFFITSLAIRVIYRQINEGTIYDETPGKGYNLASRILTWISGLLFLIGIIFFLIFVLNNMGGIICH